MTAPEAAGSGRRRRWWTVVALAVVAVPLGWYAANVADVHRVGRSDQARAVDAIVVMGAAQYDGRPSPLLAARLDHDVELWASGYAPVVVTTGGKQPDDRFTEAASSAAYLVERGVPADAIVEVGGSTSYESLAAAASVLASTVGQPGVGAAGRPQVLLVSDPFHSLRIRLIAGEVGLEAFVSPTRSSPVEGWAARRRELAEAAGVALGRIIGFRRLSDLVG
ncbi:MAG: hypothetical protein RLY45_2070 [Actinomycetota bacterium]